MAARKKAAIRPLLKTPKKRGFAMDGEGHVLPVAAYRPSEHILVPRGDPVEGHA